MKQEISDTIMSLLVAIGFTIVSYILIETFIETRQSASVLWAIIAGYWTVKALKKKE